MKQDFVNGNHKKIPRGALSRLYNSLLKSLGSQHWWPGDSPFEIMIGAILTQNTNWENVARSIDRLKNAGMLNPKQMYKNRRYLPELIRSCGYFRVKSKRLIAFLKYYLGKYQGSFKKISMIATVQLRSELLAVNGIGNETADSILLYAFNRPLFVVDAYTRRIFARHRMIDNSDEYLKIQRVFHDNIPKNTRQYNEYHALLVRLGKKYCHKNAPDCTLCPINSFQ